MEPIIVTLSEARSKTDISKHIKDEQLDESFDSLIKYMITNEQDEVNGVYEGDKLRVVDSIKRAYDDNKTSGNLVLTYLSSNDNKSHKVNLSDIVRDQEGILHDPDELFNEDSIPYKQIQLTTTYNGAGGQ